MKKKVVKTLGVRLEKININNSKSLDVTRPRIVEQSQDFIVQKCRKGGSQFPVETKKRQRKKEALYGLFQAGKGGKGGIIWLHCAGQNRRKRGKEEKKRDRGKGVYMACPDM